MKNNLIALSGTLSSPPKTFNEMLANNMTGNPT